jgi:transcriptional regulator with XRE-family HTH domain
VSFDQERFYRALERHRSDLDLSWRAVARELDISASTLSRLSRGCRPDLDTFLKLVTWLGEPAESFLRESGSESLGERRNTIGDIAESLRQDDLLTRADAETLEQLVTVAYRRFTTR